MFSVTVDGLKELQRAMQDLENMPLDVQIDMLDAQADVVADAQVYTAGTMLIGPYYEGAVARAVSKSKPRKRKSGPYIDITFKGMQHGTRLAEIAFINEYGKKSQPARPFIRKANDDSMGHSEMAALQAYDKWLKTKGL
jgi:hypothetical protein